MPIVSTALFILENLIFVNSSDGFPAGNKQNNNMAYQNNSPVKQHMGDLSNILPLIGFAKIEPSEWDQGPNQIAREVKTESDSEGQGINGNRIAAWISSNPSKWSVSIRQER